MVRCDRLRWLLIAEFHYTDTDTDQTGPGSPTKSAHVIEYELNSTTRTCTDPTEFRRKKSPCGSVRVRSGPCRVRVVEFSFYVVSCDISACVSAATRRKTSDQISCVRYHLLKQHLLDRTILLRWPLSVYALTLNSICGPSSLSRLVYTNTFALNDF